MEKLIEILTMIKDECIKRPCNCNGCPFYDDVECMIENTPCMWDVENIEQALARMEKENG